MYTLHNTQVKLNLQYTQTSNTHTCHV